MVTKRRKKGFSPVFWVRRGKRLVRRDCNVTVSGDSVGSNELSELTCSLENGFLNSTPKQREQTFCIVARNRKKKKNSHVVPIFRGMENVRKTNIVDLPEECLVMILSYLGPHEICRVSSICKKFFEASQHPGLWWKADFRFVSLMSTKFVAVDSLEVETIMTNSQRRKLFAMFLVKRKAALRSLEVDFDACEEGEIIVKLIECCNVKNLTSVDMRWWKSWDYLVDGQSVKEVSAFQQILQKLLQLCPGIKSLKCEIDLSGNTARLISQFRSIENLSLVFLRMCRSMYTHIEYGMESSHLETIISSLPNLQHLKIRTRQSVPDDFPGYVVKSAVLKTFDCSWCKCFRIRDLDLPSLHTFEGINSFDFRSYQPCPCLFKLIEKGCPKIQQLNKKKFVVSGLKNFRLNNFQKQQMFICSCPEHAPWRENF